MYPNELNSIPIFGMSVLEPGAKWDCSVKELQLELQRIISFGNNEIIKPLEYLAGYLRGDFDCNYYFDCYRFVANYLGSAQGVQRFRNAYENFSISPSKTNILGFYRYGDYAPCHVALVIDDRYVIHKHGIEGPVTINNISDTRNYYGADDVRYLQYNF